MTESPILRERIDMHRAGASIREIARKHGVSPQAIYQSLRKAGENTARNRPIPAPPVNPEEEAAVARLESCWGIKR